MKEKITMHALYRKIKTIWPRCSQKPRVKVIWDKISGFCFFLLTLANLSFPNLLRFEFVSQVISSGVRRGGPEVSQIVIMPQVLYK